ncbi:putative ABC transport system ATP-binding protein [Enterobacter sp. BIGb0383]|uniref:ABC transporter ATP-binding protein n=1 Tax=unclassified Enterobacter TaxID=2608935 RepID=UPI000F4AE412|nr:MULTISPECIES: ABC transporter ATP-binding protein [unclassified Enterobacter]ROP59497.1 putative ABC transport system ATP-binding protein [Enterobacter sp. BIGb0383]ROS09036.1 putative ABC transport system ATP-binding protein [Enterobacter sp. BIGb0359]
MLSFLNIKKDYRLGTQVVKALGGVDGEILSGEMVALCGPSGSGKSTLLNILGMLDMNYQGNVFIDGKPFPRKASEATAIRRNSLGFVFQRFNLIPVMTAIENVAYPLTLNKLSAKTKKEKAEQILIKVGLEDFLDYRPERLSGGQQQRVAIARALVHQPRLVIADEPTASLDSHSANTIIQIMKTLGHEMGTTFVIATHDSRMASQCDRYINLIDGLISSEEIKWNA